MLKLVIIDLDDTIINYTYAHRIAFEKLIQAISNEIKMTFNDIKTIYTVIKEKLYKDYDKQFVRHDKLLQLKLVCNKLNLTNIATIFKLYELYETTYLKNINLYENCTKFLDICNNKGCKVAIMTNNLLHIQLKVCTKLDLHKYIDSVFTSNEFIYEKPDKGCLQYILDHYDVSNDEVIIIGDSIINDIQWGIENNIKTILCDHKSVETSFINCINVITTMNNDL
jgi:HAD superfamily hydrolase (TIGR01549 family)